MAPCWELFLKVARGSYLPIDFQSEEALNVTYAEFPGIQEVVFSYARTNPLHAACTLPRKDRHWGDNKFPSADRKHQDLLETLQAIAVVNKECLSQSHANCASRQITCRPCGCGWARLVQLSQDDAGCFR
jgi:hypothetical protein